MRDFSSIVWLKDDRLILSVPSDSNHDTLMSSICNHQRCFRIIIVIKVGIQRNYFRFFLLLFLFSYVLRIKNGNRLEWYYRIKVRATRRSG